MIFVIAMIGLMAVSYTLGYLWGESKGFADGEQYGARLDEARYRELQRSIYEFTEPQSNELKRVK